MLTVVANIFNALFNNSSAIVPQFLFNKPPRFSLDMSAVASLLGGDNAVSGMAAVHVYGSRRWLGWYNNPGSFQIAKQLRSFTNTSFRSPGGKLSTKSHSNNVHTDPTKLFELEDCVGPKFRGAHSGTIIEQTGYLAALFLKECTAWDSEGKVVPGRKTQPVGVTIVDLGQAPPSEMRPARSGAFTLFTASIPIAVSVATCALCFVYGDWWASLLILVGIVASGVACYVLGSADLVFTHPEPAKGSPAGDGILGSDKDIILLRGTEGAVNSITRGKFSLRFSSEGHYRLVRRCSFLFLIQAATQLLGIAQATLFGQIMFVTSLTVSALYNAWLSSVDKEKIHQKLLFERVLENPTLTKYTLGTRTSAVVFVILVLQPQSPLRLLNELLPNDTKVWKQWKSTVVEQLRRLNDQSFELRGDLLDLDGFTQQDKDLLQHLYGDARAAYNGYKDYLRIGSL